MEFSSSSGSDLISDSLNDDERISKLMRDLIVYHKDGLVGENNLFLDKIFMKIKFFLRDKPKKYPSSTSNGNNNNNNNNNNFNNNNNSIFSSPNKSNSSSTPSTPSSTSFTHGFEDEITNFLSLANLDGIDGNSSLLIYLLIMTKSILLNFIQDKLLKQFILSTKAALENITNITSQQEDILSNALNNFVSFEAPVSDLSNFFLTMFPSTPSTPTSSSPPNSVVLSEIQFSLSNPINIQDIANTLNNEFIDDSHEESSIASSNISNFSKESQKKASMTMTYLKSFCSSFFFLLENCPALLNLKIDQILLEKFYWTLIKLQLPRYSIRLIQFYPDLFTPSYLQHSRNILIENNDMSIISAAYVSIFQVRNALKNNYSSFQYSNQNSNQINEEMLKPELITNIIKSIKYRKERNKKDDTISLLFMSNLSYKQLADEYINMLLPLEKTNSNRAILDLVAQAPSITTLTLNDAKEINFKCKLRSYVKKNKWVIASSFCKDLKSNLHLFDILMECEYYSEAKQLYETKYLSGSRPPVDQKLIEIQIENNNSAYLRYPEIPISIVSTSEEVVEMAKLIGVSLESKIESFPDNFNDHVYTQEVCLNEFFKYSNQGFITLNKDSTSSPYRQIVGIDAEWAFDSQKGASILQISIPNHVFILDLLRIGRGENFEEDLLKSSIFLNNLFRDPSILKVTFDFFLSDLKMIGMTQNNYYSESVKSISSILDLKKSIKEPNGNYLKVKEKEKGGSLSNLANRYLGKPLNKGQQVSHWDTRPLSKSQLSYAALDSHVLLAILDVLLIENDSSFSLSLAENVYKSKEIITTHKLEMKKLLRSHF